MERYICCETHFGRYDYFETLPPHPHKELNREQSSDHQSLHVILQRLDLAHQVAGLVRRDARRYHRTTHSTRPSQRDLAGDVNVGHILILRE